MKFKVIYDGSNTRYDEYPDDYFMKGEVSYDTEEEAQSVAAKYMEELISDYQSQLAHIKDTSGDLENIINSKINEVVFNDKGPHRGTWSLIMYPAKVLDLFFLNNLTNVSFLDLTGTNFGDLSPLKKLTKLKTLFLPYTPGMDLSVLKDLTKLKCLRLRRLDKKPIPKEEMLAIEKSLPKGIRYL